ncbi:hypothetical protein CEXT_789581 [Caerostris extrusa]|uniref:Secreted protein n=1 Tax=Caerostris extrusa TaxID=172846 RepID=A0AAV4R8N7_CAEEX|nr:hypothetical protein CEXT_789581 [Caerostris extrusa]
MGLQVSLQKRLIAQLSGMGLLLCGNSQMQPLRAERCPMLFLQNTAFVQLEFWCERPYGFSSFFRTKMFPAYFTRGPYS